MTLIVSPLKNRLKEALNIRGMKQADLVKKTGIGKASISTYLSGSYEPKKRNIYKIAKALDVDEDWLMGYGVPMERMNSYEECEKLENVEIEKEITNKYGKNALKLLSNYNKLNKAGIAEADLRIEELTWIDRYTNKKTL
jgi:transcriptional regulator with XRE-family HTH domain